MSQTERKTKIAIVINDLAIGGAEKLVVDQLAHFDRNSFDCELISLSQFPERPNFYESVPAWVSVHKLTFNGFKDLKNWLTLWRLLRTIKPDVVISHLFFSNTVVRVLRPLLGYKCIPVEQNTYTNKTKLQIFADKILSYQSFKIVAVSKTVATFTSAQENIPLEKFAVIDNAVDCLKMQKRQSTLSSKDIVKTQQGFQSGDILFVNAARLIEQKNQELLIRVFAVFSDAHPECKLIILGEGALRDSLQKLIHDLHKEKTIFLLGFQSDMVTYYHMSDFFVLTSRIEGFAIVGIEAMACGLPMISTKTAGPDHYIEEGRNGFFIEKSTVEATVKSLERALAADYAMLKQNALAMAEHYDIRSNVKKYEDLCKAAISS
jgi:glycosyltransferase involved in cell wall biosynthesis